ncbi:hypothetical protein [Roseateles amylovorans]|uniref:Lipid/polyisoprenoid-binding YceI-like domain-containing protein n=1 Tax=Roseateles amylovorans TaxID=2978473 RepID=A0ABY6B6F8_9BURK|nr:hypothetical protein [Roseateles amylovorans]UXH79913.1 hypothetical protein N4261_08555 [Roseateles amylovorans]
MTSDDNTFAANAPVGATGSGDHPATPGLRTGRPGPPWRRKTGSPRVISFVAQVAVGVVLASGLAACGTRAPDMGAASPAPLTSSPRAPTEATHPPNLPNLPMRPSGATAAAPSTAAKVATADASTLPALRCPEWLTAQRRDQGRLYAVDGQASQIHIHVFRAGRLASLGHNHVLGVDRLVGHVYVPQQGLGDAGVELAFRLEDLIIDRAEWRQALGAEFASQPSADDIAGTRTNLLRALEASDHPEVLLRSRAVEGAWPRLVLTMAVQLHGQVRTLEVALDVARPGVSAAVVPVDERGATGGPGGPGDSGAGAEAAPLRAKGRLVIRQSEFGLKPFAVLGGLLAVQDALVVDLDLVAQPVAQCRGA